MYCCGLAAGGRQKVHVLLWISRREQERRIEKVHSNTRSPNSVISLFPRSSLPSLNCTDYPATLAHARIIPSRTWDIAVRQALAVPHTLVIPHVQRVPDGFSPVIRPWNKPLMERFPCPGVPRGSIERLGVVLQLREVPAAGGSGPYRVTYKRNLKKAGRRVNKKHPPSIF